MGTGQQLIGLYRQRYPLNIATFTVERSKSDFGPKENSNSAALHKGFRCRKRRVAAPLARAGSVANIEIQFFRGRLSGAFTWRLSDRVRRQRDRKRNGAFP
jgi:hypothetical protein